jgi:hypothetical protein
MGIVKKLSPAEIMAFITTAQPKHQNAAYNEGWKAALKFVSEHINGEPFDLTFSVPK